MPAPGVRAYEEALAALRAPNERPTVPAPSGYDGAKEPHRARALAPPLQDELGVASAIAPAIETTRPEGAEPVLGDASAPVFEAVVERARRPATPRTGRLGPVIALIGAVTFGAVAAAAVAPRLLAHPLAASTVATAAAPPTARQGEDEASDATRAIRALEPARVAAHGIAERDGDSPPEPRDIGWTSPAPDHGDARAGAENEDAVRRSRETVADDPTTARRVPVDTVPARAAPDPTVPSPAPPHRVAAVDSVSSAEPTADGTRTARSRTFASPLAGRLGLRRRTGGQRAIPIGPAAERRVEEQTVRRDAPPLDAAAVRRVVETGRPRLRQCYTTAVRRTGTPVDLRAELTVVIGADGYVDDVHLSGADFGGMERCIRRTAIRWTFPPSRDGGRIPIPLSFHAIE